MIIDCHGHFTTAPKTLHAWRKKQLDCIHEPANAPKKTDLVISDDEIREAIESGQLKLQRERGSDLTLFSPTPGRWRTTSATSRRASSGRRSATTSSIASCTLFPENFVGGMPAAAVAGRVARELHR